MADKSPLQRWKPFFPAFGAIDASIEAAAPEGCCSRDMYRQAMADIVEMLCDAAAGDDDDDGRAEELCRVLDAAMAEALETLRVVPVTPAMLTATDVARAVAGLLRHDSAKVRGLARAVLTGWRAAIEAALAALLQISRDEHDATAAAPPVIRCVRTCPAPETTTTLVQAADVKQAARKTNSGLDCPKTKEKRPGVSIAGHGDDRVRNEETTAGDAKRKQSGVIDRGCEAEADDVKRQLKLPKVEHRPSKRQMLQPAMKTEQLEIDGRRPKAALVDNLRCLSPLIDDF